MTQHSPTKLLVNAHKLPWEPTTFIFRGYNPYIGGCKTFIFMVLGSKGSWWFQPSSFFFSALPLNTLWLHEDVLTWKKKGIFPYAKHLAKAPSVALHQGRHRRAMARDSASRCHWLPPFWCFFFFGLERPKESMYGIFMYIWLIFMVNVGI